MKDEITDRFKSSSGPTEMKNRPSRNNSTLIGTIHTHPRYRDKYDLDFSAKNKPTDINQSYDVNMHARMPDFTFYLLNANGELKVRRCEGIRLDGYPINTDVTTIATGLPWLEDTDNRELLKRRRPLKFEPIEGQYERKPNRIPRRGK